jgi:hypothetical protein
LEIPSETSGKSFKELREQTVKQESRRARYVKRVAGRKESVACDAVAVNTLLLQYRTENHWMLIRM